MSMRLGLDVSSPGTFNVRSYGAVGDGSHDDTSAIQAAITAAGTSPVVFAPGTYRVTAPITLGTGPLCITGTSNKSAFIAYTGTSPITAIFQFLDSGPNSFAVFRDLSINGGGYAQYGVVSTTISHSTFEQLIVQGTTLAAISIGYGWDNDILECELFNNTGDGVRLTSNNNNAVNVRGCKIFNNSGWGVWAGAGSTQNYTGNTFEGNAKGAVYLQYGVVGSSVSGNYFEGNAVAGYSFTAPVARTLNSDIVINGSATDTTMNTSYPCSGVAVENNYFSSVAATSGAVYAISAPKLRISGNHCNSAASMSLVGCSLYVGSMNNSSDLDIANNYGQVANVRVDDHGTQNYVQFPLENWKIGSVKPKNFLDTNVLVNHLLVSNANPITISKSAATFNGEEVWEISAAAGGTDIWGQSFALADFPELAGQLVHFSCWAKCDDTATGVWLWASTGLLQTDSVAGTTSWYQTRLITQLPGSGTVYFGFAKFGAPSAKVYIARPVLALVGAPDSSFYGDSVISKQSRRAATGAPTSGAWALGDIVYNTSPTAGGWTGWICTVAGEPGTWKGFGAIEA